MEKRKICLEAPEDLIVAARRLEDKLQLAFCAEGQKVLVKASEKNGVCRKGDVLEIHYSKKSRFFRQLGILQEKLLESDGDFEHWDDGFFQELSTMIDTSRCGVPTVKSVCELLDRLALMGYDMAMLYTEDTVKLEGREYFGYMRGRYEPAQLKAVDDYADAYGIEIIPCLECYGHMEKYLRWSEARAIKDTSGVLMARSEDTFAFVEELIVQVSSCFRSKRIHIGMDEAWDMGRGKFLDRHGYVAPFTIFTEYMERLMDIVRRHGLRAMMWSDMYFRMGDPSHRYYEEATQIPPEVAQQIPEDVELVFWHYGEKPQCDGYMLKKHRELGRKTIFAGGLWSWCGHFPEHDYMMETTRFSLEACRSQGIRDAMATVWSNDNAEGSMFSNLFGLSFFAELCYNAEPSLQTLCRRFEACTQGDYEAFYTMRLYHNAMDEGREYPKYNERFLGKPLFWQDVLEGLYDSYLLKEPMSPHYAACCQKMKEFQGGPWEGLYRMAESVFDYLAVKTLIAERLVPAYREGKKEVLAEIARVLLPLLQEKTAHLRRLHRKLWMEERNLIGWCNLEIRYAGVEARCETAQLVLERYLAGEDAMIASLEEPRLKSPLSGFIHYSQIASPNLKT